MMDISIKLGEIIEKNWFSILMVIFAIVVIFKSFGILNHLHIIFGFLLEILELIIVINNVRDFPKNMQLFTSLLILAPWVFTNILAIDLFYFKFVDEISLKREVVVLLYLFSFSKFVCISNHS